MSKAEMGGPAFPEQRRVIRAGYETKEFEPCSGMTLRDYFAAEAMPLAMKRYFHNITRDSGACWVFEDNEWDIVAEQAYLMADAMLKARKQ